jgi:lipopolysaccharide transport system ATP-binding protein
MSDIVIRVENLGKRYTITREQRERCTALRDVLTHGAKRLTRRLLSGNMPSMLLFVIIK